MSTRTKWTPDKIQFLKDNHWELSYSEISEEIGLSPRTVNMKAKHDLNLPKSTEKNQIEHNHAISIDRILHHLYYDAEMTTYEIAESLGVTRQSIHNWFEDAEIDRRSYSEALEIYWEGKDGMEHTKPARDKLQKMGSNGEHISMTDHPMEGVTGQDSPNWKGGTSIYYAIRSQLHGDSWKSARNEYLSEECYKCGQSDGRLDLHHIIPILAGGTNEQWNLMTLCPSCHGQAESFIEGIVNYPFRQN